ncbi:MAG TPA: mitochondrial fission ELM1 family protein [Asticcacaulis sp.]|nr:mitochondrial fission ELM1 family protein [Asticcacaulis sp.]
MPEQLSLWAVTDGRAGIENQALGLAEAVARLIPAEIIVKRLRYAAPWDRLPTALKLWPDAMLRRDSDRIEPPYPDIWIGCGRASLPHALRMRMRSGGKTFVVQLQDPKTDLKPYDLVIAPEHDHVGGANVLSLLGSTHRVTPERLATAYEVWRDRIDALPQPRIGVLVGGRSKAFDLDADHAVLMARDIRAAIEKAGGSVLLTVSRRTPPAARAVLTDGLRGLPGVVYDGTGDNPYFAFLHAADRFLVTEDSVNMATEAAATGKPVQIVSLPRRTLGGGAKFEDFHESLRARGVSHPFEDHLSGDPYPSLNETARAAQILLDRYRQKYG